MWAAIPWGSTPTPPVLQVEERAVLKPAFSVGCFFSAPAPLPGLSQCFLSPCSPSVWTDSDGTLDLTVCARAAAGPRKLLVMQLHSSNSQGTKWLWRSKWARVVLKCFFFHLNSQTQVCDLLFCFVFPLLLWSPLPVEGSWGRWKTAVAEVD